MGTGPLVIAAGSGNMSRVWSGLVGASAVVEREGTVGV